jgi:anthranilate phosphoribosyltransferase
MITAYLGRVSAGENLTMDEMAAVMTEVMAGRCQENEIALLLTALKAKGETADEIAGAAQVMRQNMTPIRSTRQGIVDTCGTGGVGSNIFNVSTAAALVTAAAGVPVAKHGNRSATSKSGSADVLQALGVNIAASVETVERCLGKLGICFCFAPSLHPAMKHVAAIRKQLGTATIFNLLGPLCNPAGASFQVLGVGKPELQRTMAEVLQRLGTKRAVVVGGDGVGEVTITGTTQVHEVTPEGIRSFAWSPADFGLETAGKESLVVDGPQSSAAIIRDVLAGKPGPRRDMVLINSAAALWVAGFHDLRGRCARRAAEAIDSGKAAALLQQLVKTTQETTPA